MSIVAKMQWYIFTILRVEAFGTKKDDHVMLWSKKHLTEVWCSLHVWLSEDQKQKAFHSVLCFSESPDPGAWMANLDQLVIFIHVYFQTYLKTRCVPLHMYVTFFFTCRWKNMLIYPFLIQNSPDFCIFVIFFAALAWVFLLWVLSCAEEHVHNSCSLHWTHKDNVRRTWNK